MRSYNDPVQHSACEVQICRRVLRLQVPAQPSHHNLPFLPLAHHFAQLCPRQLPLFTVRQIRSCADPHHKDDEPPNAGHPREKSAYAALRGDGGDSHDENNAEGEEQQAHDRVERISLASETRDRQLPIPLSHALFRRRQLGQDGLHGSEELTFDAVSLASASVQFRLAHEHVCQSFFSRGRIRLDIAVQLFHLALQPCSLGVGSAQVLRAVVESKFGPLQLSFTSAASVLEGLDNGLLLLA
mmetsp:Transcript_8041/g.18505  ORF Transcript_8041/g.18505 Transcript_8041/m.18505 type:complete len:242 (-) Transcript_8041:1000-1725(-)